MNYAVDFLALGPRRKGILNANGLGRDEARDGFPDLAQIDSVWLPFTAVWDADNVVFFFRAWANGVTDRFKVEDA